jgi:thymidylate kinase
MPRDINHNQRAILVSFSGVDGSGKSTQIENLRAQLEARGLRTRLLAFWDNVVVGCGLREGFVHKAYGSQRGVGAPGKPVERRDKNVRRWYLTLSRYILYFADALHLAWVARVRRKGKDCDVLIFDRYIYDELVNLPLASRFTRWYVRLVTALVPRPNIAYLLDADPDAARERKPEYPLEFMRQCRRAYKDLALMLRSLTFIPALPLEDAKARVEHAFWLTAALPKPVPATPAVSDVEAA